MVPQGSYALSFCSKTASQAPQVKHRATSPKEANMAEQSFDDITTAEATATAEALASQEQAKAAESEEQTAGEEVAEFEIEDVTKNEKGKLEWRADPDDPNSTKYEGDTIKELMANIRKGVQEKDSYIRKLKADKVAPDSHRGKPGLKGTEESPAVEYPDQQKIMLDVCKQYNVDPRTLNWTNTEWKNYADEQGLRDFEIMEQKQAVREVTSIVQAKVAEGNVAAINDQTLEEETEAVKGLLAKSKIDVEQFNYEAVLTQVFEDPKNFTKSGVRKVGRIVAAATEAITDIIREGAVKSAKQRMEEDIASGKDKKKGVTAQGSSRRDVDKVSDKAPTDFEDATRKALADLKAGRFKTE